MNEPRGGSNSLAGLGNHCWRFGELAECVVLCSGRLLGKPGTSAVFIIIIPLNGYENNYRDLVPNPSFCLYD